MTWPTYRQVLQKIYDVATNSIRVRILNGFNLPDYDEVIASYPSATVETYTFKKITVTVAVITITYTSTNKKFIDNVVRSS